MASREIKLLTKGFPDHPALDTAVAHALLRRVGAGTLPETVRFHQPGRIVAFGRQDALSDGYSQAVEAAREHEFESVERLAGGRAAVFHEGTLAFAWATPEEDPRRDIRRRFESVATIIQTALRTIGVETNVGGIPGEYCPGDYSLNVRGIFKVMGVGQRLIAGAAHIGGVIVVGGGDDIRGVLIPVYAHLGIDWDPTTAGDLARIMPGITVDDVRKALIDELRKEATIVPSGLDAATLELAATLAPRHEPRPGRS